MCRGAWTGVQWYMEWCRGSQRYVQRCVGRAEVCRNAQKVTEVHRCMWRCMEASQRCMEEYMEVQGAGQRGVWRWTESIQRYAGDCIQAYRGM